MRFYIPVGSGYAGVIASIASQDGGGAMLDPSGRLVQMNAATLGTFISGPGATPSGYSDSTYTGTVTFANGQHADGFRSSDGSVVLGRWTGGTVTIDNGAGIRQVFDLGGRSVAYLVTAETPSAVIGSFTGSATYSLASATAPTDAAGHVGSVTSASVSANFGTHTISGNLGLAINGNSYALAGSGGLVAGDPHFSFASSLANLTISCSGSCASGGYLGTMNGTFSGPTAQWIGINYRINPNRVSGGAYDDFIIGTLALNTPTAPKIGMLRALPPQSYLPSRAALMPPTLAPPALIAVMQRFEGRRLR